MSERPTPEPLDPMGTGKDTYDEMRDMRVSFINRKGGSVKPSGEYMLPAPAPESDIDEEAMVNEYKRLHSEQYQKAQDEVETESDSDARGAA